MVATRTEAGRLARMIFRRAPTRVTVSPDDLLVRGARGETRLPRGAVAAVTAERGLLWDSLRIERGGPDERAAGTPLRVRGLPRGAAAEVAHLWAAWGAAPDARSAARAFRRLLERDAYVNHRALTEWRTRAAGLDGRLREAFDTLPLPEDVKRDLADCRRYLADAGALVAARNDAFVAHEKVAHAAWFAAAGGRYGLTDEQQEAILRDEDNTLVVAGAGTGKTSTVAGKVGYLLRTGSVRPHQILLLSFTKKAAMEMAERLATTIGEDVALHVRTATFHGIGVEIVAVADGVRPSLSKLAEDSRALEAALRGHLEALFDDPATRDEMAEFFAYHQFPYHSPFEFRSAHAYYQYVRGHELRTLRGELVRSHEELVIADWLHMHAVTYEYERAYQHDTATVRHRQYKPDFHLPDFDLYLEHFGIDRDGNTAPWIDRAKYAADIEWKRETHRQYGTCLVETYSYEHREGVLFASLEAKLRAAGVTLGALDAGAVLAEAAQRRVDPVVRLLATFLNLYKGNLWTLDAIETAARARVEGSTRLRAFLRVFRWVLERYEADLTAAREIDFNDMIALATERVESGRFTSPFTHVIVDEFQDLSRGRARLLTALLAQVPDCRLFCVGDDWQSIYRFAGSDIEQMTRFADAFGFTHRCDLTLTHRFNQELLAASSRFVQQNPAQLTKTLRARTSLGAPPIEVHSPNDDEDADALLGRVLSRIAGLARTEWRPAPAVPDARPTVLVLGRYNFTKPASWLQLRRLHRGLALDFLTVHRAKGLEADYTVLLDVTAGRLGFPAEMVDDPVLDLVLAGTGGFPNAEERRLFYVALTRATTRCFVLTDAARRSPFVEEIEGERYRAWVVPSDSAADVAPACPTCGGGRLLRREGEYGAFWGCSNYPYCEGKARSCPACGEGALVRGADAYRCSVPSCGHVAPVCPSCGQGMLLERRGRTGRFLGCSEWRPEGAGASCGYTRDLGGGRAPRRRTA